ncbi:SAM-dependent methyltransferase [Chryseobacterium lactis]|uniref:SAM-dependent methyltransferase n=1 Tax=Chryseobacterium lactis TaxID=1241981 RepID=A0A3G6RKH8_CHRLC|nr:class I SAM-dependent methyltransferase [Chryseobacterium lactis]AZA80469.1 class I SAM-dependent methyltransferase [Chryseobacterium lactis]AZB05471.1 class I SAM-dependent methyltransferase [Chryseobacterium lactis]PNW11394.1 SAM-dependent methyltransferase [Chryseobacterium lactis]
MKENKYDNPSFFDQYEKMLRSQLGLEGAGEWHALKTMLPDFKDKKVLDLGCGFGWHCRYTIENGAQSVIGIDLSEKMLAKAKEINNPEGIQYERKALEDVTYPEHTFDIVLSSLTLHYIESFASVAQNVHQWLVPGGYFVFSVEHPVFTAEGSQDWIYDKDGEKTCWPVDRYFIEEKRNTTFLGENVIKYHRTLTSYLNTLIRCGFTIKEIIEPEPGPEMLKEYPEMKDELRRPMMLLISVQK